MNGYDHVLFDLQDGCLTINNSRQLSYQSGTLLNMVALCQYRLFCPAEEDTKHCQSHDFLQGGQPGLSFDNT